MFALALAVLLLQTPDATVPTGAHVLQTVLGTGNQIYRCTQQQWVFQSPQATLTDVATGEHLGTHAAGPRWTWKDLSAVEGEVSQKLPSPDPASIPWLLLRAHPVAQSQPGFLSAADWVRRSDTKGGNAPAAGCDTAHEGTTLRVPYTATYTFYTNDK